MTPVRMPPGRWAPDRQRVPYDAARPANGADELAWAEELELDEAKWPMPLRIGFMVGVSLASWAAIILGAVWAFG